MKKNFKFLLLAPCFMAILCEDASDECGLENPEPYVINVENNSESYAQGETIWIDSRTSSMLINSCTSTESPELITEEEVFLDGVFLLKLNNNLNGLNAEVVQDAFVTYEVGETFSFNVCSNAIYVLPQLTEDNQFYEYNMGIAINIPGDYCIVSARYSIFDNQAENNDQIFDEYNTLGNRIQFENCGDIYSRNGTDNHYFFRIE